MAILYFASWVKNKPESLAGNFFFEALNSRTNIYYRLAEKEKVGLELELKALQTTLGAEAERQAHRNKKARKQEEQAEQAVDAALVGLYVFFFLFFRRVRRGFLGGVCVCVCGGGGYFFCCVVSFIYFFGVFFSVFFYCFFLLFFFCGWLVLSGIHRNQSCSRCTSPYL